MFRLVSSPDSVGAVQCGVSSGHGCQNPPGGGGGSHAAGRADHRYSCSCYSTHYHFNSRLCSKILSFFTIKRFHHICFGLKVIALWIYFNLWYWIDIFLLNYFAQILLFSYFVPLFTLFLCLIPFFFLNFYRLVLTSFITYFSFFNW